MSLASPDPLPNGEFICALGRAYRPASDRVKIRAVLLRTDTELILKSRPVMPGRLLKVGFSFEFPERSSAARDLCAR